ncbi:glutaredoxin [Ancylostoma duodenale]|uniref:Glutaredoxin n=1 Tax=Ancylostoma duodenale TaxID=51022 RepID=A0A0C2FHI8_9BILA|nr:glutaredoxin [Ancylostoma duodenale]
MYTKEHCPYCIRAKNELQADRVSYVEKNLSDYGQKAEAAVKGLVELTQCRTVPQIFVCGKSVFIQRPWNVHGGQLSLRMHSLPQC